MNSPIGILQAAAFLGSGFSSWDKHQERLNAMRDVIAAGERAQAEADDAEYVLIQAKQSKLSAQQRRNVCYRVERRRLLLEYYAANHRPDADDLDVAPIVLDLGTGTREELKVQLDAHPGYTVPTFENRR